MLRVRVRVQVTVRPRSRRRAVQEDGDTLVVWVRSPPTRGRANEEVRELLANHFGVSKERVRLIRGWKSREKVFEVELPEGGRGIDTPDSGRRTR